MDLEKRLNEKLKNKNIKKNVLKEKGTIIKKNNDSIKIVNINDFKQKKGLIEDIIKKPLLNGKALLTKKFIIYPEQNQLYCECLLDGNSETYYLGNIILKIPVNSIRLRVNNSILIDNNHIFIYNNTLFLHEEQGFINGMIFETNEYISSIQEGKQKKKKILLDLKKKKKIIGEQHKIRYSSEQEKIFIS